MKVALIAFGFEEYCMCLANGLAQDNDVLLLLPKDDSLEYESLLESAVCYRPFKKPRLRQPLRQLAGATSLLRQIRRFRPDVIHFQHGHLWFNFALPWLRSFPIVLTVHDPRHNAGDCASQKTPQALMDFGYRQADRIIVHGEVLKCKVVEQLRIAANQIDVIPHVAMGVTHTPLRDHTDTQTILFFGRIWKYKGLEYLIRAEPMIAKALPDAKVVIAGKGDDFAPYQREMECPERFVVHNRYISATERDELFRSASVVVLPYIDATQSGVIPVAYSYGKPVVATRVGALAEAVDDGLTGLLVPPRDPVALATAVIELLADPARRQAMGAAGRQKLDRECSPREVARQSLNTYRRAIDSHANVSHLTATRGRVATPAR